MELLKIKLYKPSDRMPKMHSPSDFYNWPHSKRLLLIVEGDYCFGYVIKTNLMGKEQYNWMIEGRTGPWKITHWGYLKRPKGITSGNESYTEKKFNLKGIPDSFKTSETSIKHRRTKSKKK